MDSKDAISAIFDLATNAQDTFDAASDLFHELKEGDENDTPQEIKDEKIQMGHNIKTITNTLCLLLSLMKTLYQYCFGNKSTAQDDDDEMIGAEKEGEDDEHEDEDKESAEGKYKIM